MIDARLARERWLLVCSNFVRAEAHGLILGRTNRSRALQFLEELPKTGIRVVAIEAQDEASAMGIIRAYDDEDFSLTDATSFAIMNRLGLRSVFSFDEDFARYGFQRLA